jgi:uncharacterized protein with von Willebrand factor type A (vWA) domain
VARSRYWEWDGTQTPIDPDVEVGDLLDEISDDLLSGISPKAALRRLMRRGLPGRRGGLEQLARRLRERRRRMARELNLTDPLKDYAGRLDEVLEEERLELSASDEDDARIRESLLDALPEGVAGRLQELMHYDFTSASAKAKFDELVRDLQRQVLEANFRQLSRAMQAMSPDDVARFAAMLRALLEMIEERKAGREPDFAGFMATYGDLFPENPRTLDELLEAIARRMAAASRLLESMSPEQRRALEDLMQAALADLDMAFEMDRLRQELQELMPNLPWDMPLGTGEGTGPRALGDAIGAIEEMSDLEELERAMTGGYPGASIDDVDEERLRRALGEEAVTDVRRLKQIEKALEDAGIVERHQGRLELTPRGARRIGERALVRVFEDLHTDTAGGHESREAGGPAEPTGATRPWRFGDEGEISVQRTVYNAVLRSAGGQTGGRRVALSPDDFELVEAESRTRTATALLLDLSFSMPLRGHWVPAKRMALALQALIEGKYPQDRLYLVGFSDYARRLQVNDLTASGPLERVYGTNMQHAFMLARRLLAEHPRSSRQVIMVTDGEPTAHLVDDDQADGDAGARWGPDVFFSWPPTHETIEKTLAEALRLTAAGITLNIFMLEEEEGLVRFMRRLGQLTGGRVFQASNGDLEHFVLTDFVRRRSR